MLKNISFNLAKMDITERIAKAIEHSQMSKSGIAKMCGVSPSAISQWLNSETKAPTAANLLKLSRATGVSYAWLIEGTGGMLDIHTVTSDTGPKENAKSLGHVVPFEDDDQLAPGEVAVSFFREVELSDGSGGFAVQEVRDEFMRMPLRELQEAGVEPSLAACIVVSGDSMEPVLPDGSTIAINKGVTRIKDGEIYAIDHGGLLRVKRLYRLPHGRISLRSFNSQTHPDEDLSAEESKGLRIIGHCFWWKVVRKFS
ncbi:helix-turn-helix transcriptional regulator [Kushneria sp. AK178]